MVDLEERRKRAEARRELAKKEYLSKTVESKLVKTSYFSNGI
jgi:hypothetical protein